MNFRETDLPGVIVVEPRVFDDDRGFFYEVHHQEKFAAAGIDAAFVQDNHSHSRQGTLRGLHFQEPNAQGKLVRAVRGEIFDVAVDIRRGSPTFGKWTGLLLSETNRLQLWVPAGFAHGFCVTSDTADVVYKCTDLYAPESEHAIIWNDPDIGIEWPVDVPALSAKDAKAPMLMDCTALPGYG